MNSVPSQEKPPDLYPPLSEAETQAIEILTGYGIDFAPAYIGRARAWQKNYAIQNPSAQQIVDQCMELIKFDEEQKAYLKRRREEMGLSNLYNELADKLASTEPATIELVKVLREQVEQERANAAINTGLRSAQEIRATLYPDTISGQYIGRIRLGSYSLRVYAWPRKDFINVQVKVE